MRFLDAGGQTLDHGLAVYFPAPASFTGEHVLELQGHGGVVVMDLLLQRLLSLGCRLARAGEFSERAFLNGKMDITQAEAVADLIDAGTATAARAAVRSMQGEFSARIAVLQAQLTDLRAYVEAAIDFPDEEIDFLSSAALEERLGRVFATFGAIEAAARQGTLLREGLTVVLAGQPNAGKSSLLNRLVGDDVAIVTALPGTTRDVLRHVVQLDGMPLTLIDTAGLRDPADEAEAEGVRRARQEILLADRVLHVVDGSVEADVDAVTPAALDGLPTAIPVTLVVSKIDLGVRAPLGEESATCPRVFVSALTGEGIAELRSHLKATVGYHESDAGALTARRRHLDALRRAADLVKDAAATLSAGQAELFAEDLRLAQQCLGEITGEFTADDLLGQIFGSFCIGK